MMIEFERRSKPLAISSTANTTPAIGVLNAAATPAAPPATSSARRLGPPRRPEVRAKTIAAVTCTVGPSRPIDAPHSKRKAAASTLKPTVRSDIRGSDRPLGPLSSDAAITWGMPLPAASGAISRVSQVATTSPTGRRTRAAHGETPARRRCRSIPRSHSLANPTAAAPAQIDAATITAIRQARLALSRARRRRDVRFCGRNQSKEWLSASGRLRLIFTVGAEISWNDVFR